ncbi:MAG TPA: ATP-dependent DNA helicase RecQ [Bacillota bacterium]
MRDESQLEDYLQSYFGYPSFRMGQKEIINDVMKGKDVLGVLPTGSGKSICYQLPAMLLRGTTIVVSPLIALMIDQVKQLKANGFKSVVALNSFVSPVEKKKIYQQLAHYKLVYASPELLQNQVFLRYLDQIEISLFVVDEAHCISQWGHEFRPDYLKLSPLIERFHHPTVLALSATATRTIQADIIKALNVPHMVRHIYPIDRPNIAFSVKKVNDEKEKIDVIVNFVSHYRVPTLIYFSSRQLTEDFSFELSQRLSNRRIAFYHGGMDSVDRISIQQQFMNDQLDIICCTSAFGMGIDKNNIRLIIHYHMPSQLESYIQEVGRAGRDGQASVSILLYEKNDECLPKHIIENELPSEEELIFTFRMLNDFARRKEELPADEESLATLFQVSTVQWRFLYHQFAKHGMVDENVVLYDEENWQQAFQHIKQFQQQRLQHKKEKLTDMMAWIHEKDCLRKHLYKHFQSSYTEPADQCCSNCGFSLQAWKPPETIVHHSTTYYSENHWEDKLKKLLLIGDLHESK